MDIGDVLSPSSSYFNVCGLSNASILVVTKDIKVENPNATYVTSCGTKVTNKLYFDSFAGQGSSGQGYFRNNEVRVPYKLDKVTVTLPTGYSLVPGSVSLKVNSSCATQPAYTNITASATTGTITFTNTAGGDFPRMDDCSGKTTAYEICYNIQDNSPGTNKIGKIYTKFDLTEEIKKPYILYDTAQVSNVRPDLTVTALAPIIRNSDGGTCQAAEYDFKIYNEGDTDADYVHFAVDNSATVNIVSISSPQNSAGVDSVKSYGTGLFAYIGKIAARDSLIIRVKGNTTACIGDFKILTDWSCAFPIPATIAALEVASDHEDVVNVSFEALDPKLLARPVTNEILRITDLCGEKEVEFEVRNADLPNINKLIAGIKLPTGMKYVASSMTLTHPVPGGVAVPVTVSNISSNDSLSISFNSVAPFSTACGLTGSDTTTRNNVRIKFRINFTSCPDKLSQEIKFVTEGENYCGKKAIANCILPIIYIGVNGNTNTYAISSKVEATNLCAKNGETQNVNDKIYIKNLGGGANPAISSGTDSVTFTLIYSASQMTIANLAVPSPYGAAIMGVDVQGNTTFKILVPASIAVNDSLAIPITYDLTPKVDKLCLVASKPPLCFFAEFINRIVLKCDAISLNCSSNMPKQIRGSGLTLRQFNCCYGSIGDYVWQDTDKDGQQGLVASEPVIPNVRVYLYQETTAGVFVKFDSTFTGTDGKYLFSNLFAGNYKVQFVAPTSYSLTTLNMGATATDSDAGVNGFSGIVNIDTNKPLGDIGRDNPTIDAGFIPCNLATTNTIIPPTCANNDGTINLAVTGATGTPTYAWSNGATTQNLTGLPAGDYTVTVTDGTCTATAMVSLNKPNTNIPYAICPGDSYKLEIQDNTLTGIQWLKDGVAISGANGLTYTATQIGVYTYTSNGVGGCAVGQCCPIEITLSTNCCKPQICTSVKITKK